MAAPILKQIPGGVCSPRGFLAAGVRSGLKRRGKDLALIYSVAPAVAAGLFTSNQVQGAPVLLTRQRVGQDSARAILINSGNANACTGRQGYADAQTSAAWLAQALRISPDSVLVASTGLIGQPLPMPRLREAIPHLVSALGPEGHQEAAQAILTTDTRPKEIAVEFHHNGLPVRIGAMAKGAGMIAPDLATMLCFLTTDAALPSRLLTACLRRAAASSFNCITVEGDTSPSDMLLALANGQSETKAIASGHGLAAFQAALDFVCLQMAKAIIADAEGATKFLEIRVTGAPSPAEARQVALTIANSPLVKTALFGRDPNWGRILAAAGRAPVKLDPHLLALSLAGVPVVARGAAVNFDQAALRRTLAKPEIGLTLDLGLGPASATVWTCDLTYDYVRINAEYHT
jgi:glutamate N-acetyltransferase/amino-acid N-acetyltransferase